jgi:DNA-binding NarL/FixJ family response regulator
MRLQEIRVLLSGEPDLEVVSEAEDGREALELYRRLSPDLVLMDVRMDGIEATRAIKDELPAVSVLIVTTHQDPGHLFEAVKADTAGYVLKDATRQRLLDAVRQVLAGESPLNQELAMQLLLRLSDEIRSGAARESGGTRRRVLTLRCGGFGVGQPNRPRCRSPPGRSRWCVCWLEARPTARWG